MTQSAEDGEDGQGTRGEESRDRGERLARSLFSRVSGTLSALLARIAHTHAALLLFVLNRCSRRLIHPDYRAAILINMTWPLIMKERARARLYDRRLKFLIGLSRRGLRENVTGRLKTTAASV